MRVTHDEQAPEGTLMPSPDPRPRPAVAGPPDRRDRPRPRLRRSSPPPDPADLRRAWQTIPRGSSRDDGGAQPAVDPDVWLLHVRYQRTGDEADLHALTDEYTGYALALARRLHREGEPLEDLRQVALEALVAALRRFDCDRGTPFPGFASPVVIGALKRHYRDHGWALRVPRSAHELAVPAREAADRLALHHGRPATVAEVAAELRISEEDLLLVQSATHARSTVSLDAPRGVDDAAPREVPVDDDRILGAENHVALAEAMATLSERDRAVLGLYFYEELTQTQIAERYRVSQMQVSRWISSSVARLRARMAVTDDADPPRRAPTAVPA